MRMKKAVMRKYLRCSECDAVMPIYRRKSSNRPNGHIKDLWCYKCKNETKHVEFREEQAAITAPASIPYLVTYEVTDEGPDGEIVECRRGIVQLSLAEEPSRIEEILKHEWGNVTVKGWSKHG